MQFASTQDCFSKSAIPNVRMAAGRTGSGEAIGRRTSLLKGRWRSKCIDDDVLRLSPLQYRSIARGIGRKARCFTQNPVFSGDFTRSIAQLFGGGVASIHRLADQRLLLHCTPHCSGIFGCAVTAFPRTSLVSHVYPRATTHFGAAGTCSRPHGRGSLAFPSIREGICSDSGGRTCISSGVQVAPRRCAASSHM